MQCQLFPQNESKILLPISGFDIHIFFDNRLTQRLFQRHILPASLLELHFIAFNPVTKLSRLTILRQIAFFLIVKDQKWKKKYVATLLWKINIFDELFVIFFELLMIPYYSSRCTKFVFYNFVTKWHDDDCTGWR